MAHPAKAEELARVRIAPEALLDLQRQAVHPAAHVGHTARDPDLHPGRKRDRRGSTTASSAARRDGGSDAGIVTHRPFGSVISIRTSSGDCAERSTGAGAASSITGGVKPPSKPAPPSPHRDRRAARSTAETAKSRIPRRRRPLPVPAEALLDDQDLVLVRPVPTSPMRRTRAHCGDALKRCTSAMVPIELRRRSHFAPTRRSCARGGALHHLARLLSSELGLGKIDIINGQTPIYQRRSIVQRFQPLEPAVLDEAA